jgi:hypothetical protein
MKRVFVMGNDPLLADAIVSRLAAEISPAATHHEFDRENHRSLVMVFEEGTWGANRYSVFFLRHSLRRRNVRNVTQQTSFGLFAGFDL